MRISLLLLRQSHPLHRLRHFQLSTFPFHFHIRSFTFISLQSNTPFPWGKPPVFLGQVQVQFHSLHKRYPKLQPGNLKTMKLENQDFQNLFTPELVTLSELFKKYGYEIRMAGGAVRDLLMHKIPSDIDFATTATPDEMKKMFEQENIRMINTKGEKHGTITPRINDKENFEVTTLRIDVVTDGRHAEVEFTKNWELDAGRRDLTVNSMFLGFDGTIYDYFNGIEDLEKRLVRFVGKPADRIQEDYLRILRYFRFYGRIARSEEEHEEDTLEAIRANMDGLKQISGERLWTELRKILEGNYVRSLMLKMIELGISPWIGLPDQPNIEEFETVIKRLEKLNLKVNPVTLLAALLRDETEALSLHNRLKFSANERDLCFFVVLHRAKPDEGKDIKYYQKVLLLSKNKVDVVHTWILETLKYDGNTELLKKMEEFKLPKFPINGFILTENNVPSGKPMTEVSQELKQIWLDSDFKATTEELITHIPNILSQLKPASPKRKK